MVNFYQAIYLGQFTLWNDPRNGAVKSQNHTLIISKSIQNQSEIRKPQQPNINECPISSLITRGAQKETPV